MGEVKRIAYHVIWNADVNHYQNDVTTGQRVLRDYTTGIDHSLALSINDHKRIVFGIAHRKGVACGGKRERRE